MQTLIRTAVAPEYKIVLADLIHTINLGRLEINKTVNHLYWSIGRTIVVKQEQYGWGVSIVANVSRDLEKYFGVKKGFSRRSLLYMRSVYLVYRDVIEKDSEGEHVIFMIPWYHNITIVEKVDGLEQRLWYTQKAFENS